MTDDVSNASVDKGNNEKAEERDTATIAQFEYEQGNHEHALRLLESLDNRDSKALTHNRLIAQFGVDNNIELLLNSLITSEDLDLDQQVLIDYNRALALAKHQHKYDEAIELLENRMSVLSQSISLVDDRLTIKVYLLLAVLYIERRKDPSKALPLLQFIHEKCDISCHPPRIQQLKAKCFLQMGSFKNAKRELKAMSGEPLIRSYLELQRNNYKKALKIFSSCVEDSPIHRNNDGLIQYGLGKRNTAVFCVAKAVEKNNSPEMLYNLAVLHLFTGNTKNAFDILYNLIHHFKNNPRIWFRLAECCLEERARHQEVESNKNKHDVIKGFDGGNSQSKETSGAESLSFARGCLVNSLSVLNSKDCNYYPSNAPLENDLERFKIGIFLSLSYTFLCLNDFSAAYTFATTALTLHPKGFQKVLAHLYAGESLIRLDRVDSALEHFLPSIVEEPAPVEEGSATPPPSSCSWFPNSAKVVVAFNQAVSYTIRGDLDRAAETIRLISSNISPSDNLVPVQVIMLATYIQLKQGYIDAAKSLIRQHLTQLR